MGTKAEELVDENIDLQSLADDGKEIQQEEPQEEMQLTDLEQKAYDQGWRPEDDFQGKEGNWKTAKEYITHGEYIGNMNSLHQKIDNQKKDFDDRLSKTNKLHEARKQSEIKVLKSQQRDAVNMSDTESFDKAQEQIDELEKQDTTDSTTSTSDNPQENPSIAAWNAKNPWIKDPNDERSSVATGVWNSYLAKNPEATIDQALKHVDSRISSLYPVDNTNPRRNQPNTTETTTGKARRSSKELTMNDLTADEKSEWNLFASTMFTEKDFLKTVADIRKR